MYLLSDAACIVKYVVYVVGSLCLPFICSQLICVLVYAFVAINDRDGNGYVNMTSDSADAYDPYIPHDIQDSMSHSVSVYGPYRVRTDSIESDTENSSLPNSKTLYDSSLRNCYSCPTSSVDFASGSVSNGMLCVCRPEWFCCVSVIIYCIHWHFLR